MTSNRCAVINCNQEGKPKTCPYDGRYHYHGRIHYDCGYPKSSLQFHKGEWDYVCDEHYSILVLERQYFENRKNKNVKEFKEAMK